MAPDPKPVLYRNQLLSGLSRGDRALIEPHLERVVLELRQSLEEPGIPIESVYFVETGFASVVANGSGKRVEVGIIGREGVTGLMVVLGNDRSPHETFIQLAGSALRIGSDDLRAVMAESPSLRGPLFRYAQTFMIQTAQTAVANGRGKIEERLARWLLMAHDRVDGDELPIIHEFLALMLGVRRPGVTMALHMLEGQALISSGRAMITVLDRKGLVQAAGGLYGVPEAEYHRLMVLGG